MSVLFAHLSLTTAQSQTKFVFQLVKIREFPPYVGQFFLQPALYRCARLQAIPSQSQKSADLAELESQALHAPDKGQSLDICFRVPPETSLRSSRARE
jgi:hypothetical protein